jgi:hypothetical protein
MRFLAHFGLLWNARTAGILLLNFGTTYKNGELESLWLQILQGLQLNFIALEKKSPLFKKNISTALAAIDDLGSHNSCCVSSTESIDYINLSLTWHHGSFVFIFNRRNVHQLYPYLLGGAAVVLHKFRSSCYHNGVLYWPCYPVWRWK